MLLYDTDPATYDLLYAAAKKELRAARAEYRASKCRLRRAGQPASKVHRRLRAEGERHQRAWDWLQELEQSKPVVAPIPSLQLQETR